MSIYTIALLGSATLTCLFALVNQFLKNKWIELAGRVSFVAWVVTITFLFYKFVEFTVSMFQQIAMMMMR